MLKVRFFRTSTVVPKHFLCFVCKKNPNIAPDAIVIIFTNIGNRF